MMQDYNANSPTLEKIIPSPHSSLNSFSEQKNNRFSLNPNTKPFEVRS